MLGYHDSNRCNFDLWSPINNPTTCENADAVQHGYGVWEDTPYKCAIENRAFSPYCKHVQECEEVIQMILAGGTNFELDDDFGQSDLDYIQSRLREHGIEANLSLY